MPKKDRFPHEADTAPGKGSTDRPKAGTSGPAPKRAHSQSAPTLPPPPPSSRSGKASRRPTARPKTSSIKKRAPHESTIPGATVDEVVADMSKDPRHEKD